MVCSPHQYTLQKIATPYLPAAAYLEQKNYLQKPAYQSMPQLKLYTARQTDVQETLTYRPRQQYVLSYQSNERRRNTEENIPFATSVWAPVTMEKPTTNSKSLSSTQDYGLPLYLATGVVNKISEPELKPKMKRDDLMQRIEQELFRMKLERRVQEGHLCAA